MTKFWTNASGALKDEEDKKVKKIKKKKEDQKVQGIKVREVEIAKEF